ncbi:FtsK/SpoIIIE domain-containing protein [Lentzea sp. NPDC060358]|uniref:FtsK/SpoIIIE domain-containing protein n=1 Tax=Lentzea sp. NPDC060358 TaxID=3347103 RepID=UPI003661FAAD
MTGEVHRVTPADREVLAWFERGAEPGATLLVENWTLCAAGDPGLAESLRWITATARDVRVVITAGAPNEVPEHLRPFVRTDFLALHGLSAFTKAGAWQGDWTRTPVGHRGDPVAVDLTHHEGQYRTGSHLHATTRETLRSLVLGLMTTHSPKLFQAMLVDAHDTDAFAGLDKAPHVHSHFRSVAVNPDAVTTMLLAESERRLELVGNTWTIFDHRGLDQVLPQLLVCVTGVRDILAAHPDFATTLAAVAEDVGKSGVQLLLDSPHDLAPNPVPECAVPENLDEMARALPRLMLEAEPVPDFLALHGLPDGFDRHRTWRRRPPRRQFRVPVGTDEHGQPVELDLKTASLQDGMGPHGEVVGPDRTDLLRSLLLGQMLWHPPDDLQLVLVDLHGTGVFAGLDKAPHVHGHYRGLTPATADRLVQALQGEHERRTRVLVAAEHRTTWDYRAARDNGAPLDPLPELLICLDGAPELLREHPEFLEVLQVFGQLGRSYGEHLLLSGTTPVAELKSFPGHRFEFHGGWTRRISRSVEQVVLPRGLDAVTRSLPHAMQKVEPLHDPLLPPPLHEWPRLSLDELGTISPEHGAVPIGLRDNPFEHRVEVFYATFGQGGHGAIVGKPGSGRTTAMRTLTESITRTFGSTEGFRLQDGPLYGRPDERHVVVTASTWAEVPQFIRDDLAWGVELKLADPSWSAVDERRQAILPDRPGTGLCVQVARQVRIATS